ncbi:MAG: tRNA (adenosine(37)-N6)-dimethylallyltransferase MiaA [Patescibacteria group bacterium]
MKFYHDKKLIAIVGPTATGKSELAAKLANKIGGEIISADSRAIYQGLNIGTAKVLGKWKKNPRLKNAKAAKNRGRDFYALFVYKGVPHHCVDFLPPQKAFSAADFAKLAKKKIDEIEARDRLPIICGGTGFWIDAALNPALLPNIPPNPLLRRKLVKKTVAELFTQLKKLDPVRAFSIDKNNKRRLIRAIEIASARQGLPLPGQLPGQGQSLSRKVLYLGLTLPNAELKKRIHKRFLRWLKQGLVAETKKLTSKVSARRLAEIGLAYPIIRQYLSGKLAKKEMIERCVNSIYHYAKRQKTWFRRNHKIRWIKNYQQAKNLIEKFLLKL